MNIFKTKPARALISILLSLVCTAAAPLAYAEDTQDNTVDTVEKMDAITTTRLYPYLSKLHLMTKEAVEDNVKGGEAGQIPWCFSISHQNPDLVLHATDTSGIDISYDGGKTWRKSKGGTDGCINDIQYYPGDDKYAFAHSHVLTPSRRAGIYKSSDHGESWEHVKFISNNSKVPGSKCIQFEDPDPETGIYPIFAISARWETTSEPSLGGTGVFRSTDIGETWEQIGFSDIPVTEVCSSPYDGEQLLIVTTRDPLRAINVSRDGGETFETKINGLENNGILTVAIDPLDTNHWVAAASDQTHLLGEGENIWGFPGPDELGGCDDAYIDETKCLYETFDGGETWQNITCDWGSAIVGVGGITGGSGFWSMSSRAEKYTDNMASSVRRLQYGYPYTDTETGEKKARLFASAKYVNYPFRISDDGGHTWFYPERDKTYDLLAPVSTGWYAEGMAFTPANPNMVIASLGVPYRSDDAGSSFRYTAGGISGAGSMDWNFDENGDLRFIGIYDHGVRVKLEGYDWYDGDFPPMVATEGYTLQTVDKIIVDPNNPQHCFAVSGIAPYGGTSTIVETDDGFKTVQYYKGIRDLFDSEGISRSISYLEYSKQNDNLIYSSWFVSEDNGESWRESEIKIRAISPFDGDIAYGMKDYKVYISYDKAKTWNDTGFAFDMAHGTMMADKFEEHVLWLGKHGDSLFYRLDLKTGNIKTMGPDNGIKAESGWGMHIQQFDQNPLNKDHLIVCGRDYYFERHHAFETYDGGDTWTEIRNIRGYGSYVKFNPVKPQVWFGGMDGTWIYEYEVYAELKEDGFLDTEDSFAYEILKDLQKQGYINYDEDGNFRPSESATRAELADIVCNVMKYNTDKAESSFSDVPDTHAYYKEVSAVAQNKIMSGDGASFRPDDKLTYGEAAIVLVRMLYGSDTDTSNAKERCEALGIFDFMQADSYNAEAEVRRDEMAYMINKVLVTIYE